MIHRDIYLLEKSKKKQNDMTKFDQTEIKQVLTELNIFVNIQQ